MPGIGEGRTLGLFNRKPRTASVLDGEHEVRVVGESYCQDAILQITGPKTSEGFFLPVLATLERDPKNPYDADAVGVYVEGRRVGYLPREAAALLSPRLARRRTACIVRGHINGGWKRDSGDEGFCGVVLRLPDIDKV